MIEIAIIGAGALVILYALDSFFHLETLLTNNYYLFQYMERRMIYLC